MIVELCDIRIHPGQNAAFEEAISVVSPRWPRAKGFQGSKVNRGIESPERCWRRPTARIIAWRTVKLLRMLRIKYSVAIFYKKETFYA